MEAVILSPEHPLAAGLAANRDRFNSLFLHARHANQQLDAKRFLSHLRQHVAPVLEAACAVAPDARDTTLETLYQLALEIEAANADEQYWGLWTRLLCGVAGTLCQSSSPAAAALSNALHLLSNHPGARAEEWVTQVISFAAGNPKAESVLAAGQIAAWRAGLPHFRQSALKVCRTLKPDGLARAALGMRPEQSATPVISALMALEVDPWLNPAAYPAKGKRSLQVVHAVGGFAGYGDLFNRPPRVFTSDGQIYAQDGDRYWMLLADVFGASCYPCPQPPPELPGVKPTRHAISDQGEVLYSGLENTLPWLSGAASSAANQTMLAVARELSFRIYLIAAVELV